LRYLGKDNIDDKSINKLQRNLTDKEKEQLLKDIKLATAWIAATIRKIAEPIRSE
jgi:hypothetical protein